MLHQGFCIGIQCIIMLKKEAKGGILVEKCLIWGAGKIGGSSLLKDILSQNYNVVAYCDSNIHDNRIMNALHIIDANNIKRYIEEEKISVILIGVKDGNVIKEISRNIKEKGIQNVRILNLYDAEYSQLENLYLTNMHKNMKFQWCIDFENQSKLWIDGIASEIQYWINGYHSTEGKLIASYLSNNQFDKYHPEYKEFADELKDGDIVLDIGGGITSKFGRFTERGCVLNVRTVDPLAHWYNQLLPNNIPENRKCEFGLFEFIAHFYEKESADGIIINNALDHCIDPFKSIIECLYILKVNRKIGLLHRRAEAVYEKYTGMHKWNIDYDTRMHLLIWNQDNAMDLTEVLKDIVEIKVIPLGQEKPREKQVIQVEITKKRSFELGQYVDLKKECFLLSGLLNQLMKYFAENNLSKLYAELNTIMGRKK